MLIDFKGPVYPVDDISQKAFVAILNIILLSGNIAELHRRLIEQNVDPEYRKLSGYFDWSFGDHSFTLWQRTAYNSSVGFGQKVLEVGFASFADRSGINPGADKN